MASIIERVLSIVRTAVSQPDSKDLKQDMQVSGLIREMVQTLQGNQVSTGGGAISGFTREAPFGLASLLEISGNYAVTGKKRQVLNAPPADIYWLCSFLQNAPGTTLTTSAGASATDPIRGVLGDFVTDQSQGYGGATYIDSRLYATLDVTVRWGALADLASTNLSSTSSVEWEVRVKEEVGGDLPSAEDAHFEPAVIQKQHPSTTTGTQLANDNVVTWDGLAIVWFSQQHDDSAAGNLQRVNGLIRLVDINQGGRPVVVRKTFQALLRETQTKYSLGLTTTQPDGVTCVPIDPPLDSRNGTMTVIRDTQTTPPPGITSVTAATSDRLNTTLLVIEPNPAMDEALVSGTY